MKNLKIDEGSFRDPDARVVYLNDSVYRIVYPSGFKKFDFIQKIYLLCRQAKVAWVQNVSCSKNIQKQSGCCSKGMQKFKNGIIKIWKLRKTKNFEKPLSFLFIFLFLGCSCPPRGKTSRYLPVLL